MDAKKNPNSNLEKKRAVHLQLGLLISLSVVLISLEWTSPQAEMERLQVSFIGDLSEAELIPFTKQPEKEKSTLPKMKIPVPVENDVLLEDILDENIFSTENYEQGYVFDFPDEEPEEIVVTYNETQVELMAEFPGGKDAMMKWIYDNLEYPPQCVENGVQGRVTAKFTISKFGEVKDIEIVRSVHPALDAEVMRVLKMMPKFQPAMQNQSLVQVYMYWPVVFKLN